MKGSDLITQFFIEKGISDVFGIPGGVVLDLLDSFHKKRDTIAVHLNYHEQASAFAACGYAQVSKKPALVYATKGPGVTNLITGIANAYFDSIPVLFITAHSGKLNHALRFEQKQEFDTIQMVSCITKYAVRVTDENDVIYHLEKAFYESTSGRPGPSFLDISLDILKGDINPNELKNFNRVSAEKYDSNEKISEDIDNAIGKSKRPVLLIGDGIHQSGCESYINELVNNLKIPVISSRFAQDIVTDSKFNFGFIGSHARRYSNFVLAKCDLVISLGNRLEYNPKSKSFESFARNTEILRIDVDANEFSRCIPNVKNYNSDLKLLMPYLAKFSWKNKISKEWIDTCCTLKNSLFSHDIQYPISIIFEIIKKTDNKTIITSDVGINEIWLAHAYAFSARNNRILYSKSLGASGSSLPKAIGAYYASKKRVLCFTGDVGIQMNIQELQSISNEKLPITIVLLNNNASGMIRDEQKVKFNSNYIHSTLATGYSVPNFCSLSKAFSMPYFSLSKDDVVMSDMDMSEEGGPHFLELKIAEDTEVFPKLYRDRPCQDFEPKLENYTYLDSL